MGRIIWFVLGLVGFYLAMSAIPAFAFVSGLIFLPDWALVIVYGLSAGLVAGFVARTRGSSWMTAVLAGMAGAILFLYFQPDLLQPYNPPTTPRLSWWPQVRAALFGVSSCAGGALGGGLRSKLVETTTAANRPRRSRWLHK